MSYTPNPIDVSGVELPPELSGLIERLSENSHDHWAETRIAQGWRLGPARDDAQKLHPCLIPYDQLPESEKDLDRATVLGTIRAILAMGYKIVPGA